MNMQGNDLDTPTSYGAKFLRLPWSLRLLCNVSTDGQNIAKFKGLKDE